MKLLQFRFINHHQAPLIAGLLVFAVFYTACTSPERRGLVRGIKLERNKDFKSAVTEFEHVVLRAPESPESVIAAREGAKITFFDLKDFKKASFFDQHIVLAATKLEDRETAQKQLALIYFDQLQDYPSSIREINKALSLQLTDKERTQFRIKLAKSYYFQNNFMQAESEVASYLKSNKDDDDAIFQMMVLRGNVYLAQKDISRAEESLREVLKKYPERAVKENVAMTLAVAFEETKNYKAAIETLEQMRPYHTMPEFIDLRIKKLKEDQKNQPGAKGLRRK